MKLLTIFLMMTLLQGCGETWHCVERGKTLLSISESGQLGSADKGCTCDQLREFEYRVFGEIDEEALKSDFGCY